MATNYCNRCDAFTREPCAVHMPTRKAGEVYESHGTLMVHRDADYWRTTTDPAALDLMLGYLESIDDDDDDADDDEADNYYYFEECDGDDYAAPFGRCEADLDADIVCLTPLTIDNRCRNEASHV